MLDPVPTRFLISLAPVSRQFHCLVVRILHTRLLNAASIRDHKLILECFHPSAKWSTPGLPCEYLGTDIFIPSKESSSQLGASSFSDLTSLLGLYSHFRPLEAASTQRRRVRHPAGDVPDHPNTSSAQDLFDTPQIPSQTIHLESYERFSQLCTIANLVKVGPRSGLFLSCVTIGEGTIRVFRDWLAENAISEREWEATRNEKEAILAANLNGDPSEINSDLEERVLWLDRGKNIGVRFSVVALNDHGPVLQSRDEDPAVAYTVEYEGRQIIILIYLIQLMMETQNYLSAPLSYYSRSRNRSYRSRITLVRR